MDVEYDRAACAGWFQCVQEWDSFEMDMESGKAILKGSNKVNEDVFNAEVPERHEEAAIAAAESCPTDAIKVFSDGKQIIPPE